MRAAVVDKYGPPDRVVVAETPTPEPRADQILVRVAASAVTSGDARLRSGRFPTGFGLLARLAVGIRGPRRRILGNSFSGTVERAAPGVTRFAAGDEVTGMAGTRMGCHAELVAVPAASVVRKPANVGHPDAAGVLFGGTTALYFLRDRARVRPGDAVLVNGAAGAVGSSAVQLAKHFGATVTAVTSTRNAEFVAALGADQVVDYTVTPVTALAGRYDIVFDTVGALSRAEGLRLLRPDGSLILAVGSLADMVLGGRHVVTGSAPERADDIDFLLDLTATGQFNPTTETVGGLDAVQEAHRRVDTGRKIGNLVILPGAS